MRFNYLLRYLMWFIFLVLNVSIITALTYDGGFGVTPCIYIGSWCGLGNDLYNRYYPPFNLGSISSAEPDLTYVEIDKGTLGEPLFYDFNDDGFKDLVINYQGKLYSYYWNGYEFVEQAIQTNNYNLYDDDLNLFDVDSGFTPSNNCSSDSNKYIFAHNESHYFILGIKNSDFCVADNYSLTYNSSFSKYKCFQEPSRGSEGRYSCVSLVKDISTNNSYLSYIWYDYATNVISISTTAVSDFDTDYNILQEPRIVQWDNSDSVFDYMFFYDGDNNGNFGFGIINGATGVTSFSKDNISADFNLTTSESSTTYHRKNLKADYIFLDTGGVFYKIVYYIPQYTPYVTMIDENGDTVFSTKILTDNCVVNCNGDNQAVMKLIPFNCDSDNDDEILSVISSGASTSLPAGNWALTTCINNDGSKIISSGQNLGAIESTACGASTTTSNYYKSGALTNYDGDSSHDLINGRCIYEIGSSTITKQQNYYTNFSFSSSNTHCVNFDFSDDAKLDVFCFGVSTTKSELLSTSMSNESGFSNSQVHYFYTNYDTCSPVCINNNVTFTPSFSDDESNAVRFSIDCDGDGIFEQVTDWTNDYSTVFLSCNFSQIGVFDVDFRLTDIYHQSEYQTDAVTFQVVAGGSCFSTGEWNEDCELTTYETTPQGYCGDGICQSNETISNCYEDCFTGYSSEDEIYDCSDWTGFAEWFLAFCQPYHEIKAWMASDVWNFIFTSFSVVLIIILFVALIMFLRTRRE